MIRSGRCSIRPRPETTRHILAARLGHARGGRPARADRPRRVLLDALASRIHRRESRRRRPRRRARKRAPKSWTSSPTRRRRPNRACADCVGEYNGYLNTRPSADVVRVVAERRRRTPPWAYEGARVDAMKDSGVARGRRGETAGKKPAIARSRRARRVDATSRERCCPSQSRRR